MVNLENYCSKLKNLKYLSTSLTVGRLIHWHKVFSIYRTETENIDVVNIVSESDPHPWFWCYYIFDILNKIYFWHLIITILLCYYYVLNPGTI